MAGKRSPRAAISAFHGDFGQLAAMMQSTWAGNAQESLLYTEQFLRSAFDYPGSSFELAPSIYLGSDLTAFVAGFRRNVRLNGRAVPLLLNTFLTASAESKGTGYGLMVWGELIKRARAGGYEGTINFCVEGDEMNAWMPGVSRLFRIDAQQVYTIEFLARFLRPAPEQPQPEVSDQEIELFLDLSKAIPDTVPLVRTWTAQEAVWQCRERAGAMTVSAVHEHRRGMLTGYMMDVATQPPVRVAIMEDLFWGNLEPPEQGELLDRFMRTAASRGARTISCPRLGYASMQPLTAAGFRRSKRTLHTYLTLWNGDAVSPLSSLYIDVL